MKPLHRRATSHPMPLTCGTPESKQLWLHATETARPTTPSSLDDICCGRLFTPRGATAKLQDAAPERSTTIPPKKPKPPYTPLLPYGELAALVREYMQSAPSYMQESLEELAGTMEHAEENVKDRDSELSHLSNISIAFCYATEAEPAGLPQEKYLFLEALAGPLVEAEECLGFGNDDPEEKIFFMTMLSRS